jgi:hypothetical protein
MRTTNKIDNNVCVYAHYTEEGNLFYIGIGHFKRAYDHKSRNAIWRNIVRKHGDPVVVFIEQNISWQEACCLEQKLIAFYGRRDKGGLLCNNIKLLYIFALNKTKTYEHS